MCGPKFCSMKISHEIKDFATEGKKKCQKNLRKSGGKIYIIIKF